MSKHTCRTCRYAHDGPHGIACGHPRNPAGATTVLMHDRKDYVSFSCRDWRRRTTRDLPPGMVLVAKADLRTLVEEYAICYHPNARDKCRTEWLARFRLTPEEQP